MIVETGAGLPDANSYVTVLFADSYVTQRSLDGWLTLTTADKEAALINATDFVEATFSESFRGFKRTESQALSWPRSGAIVDDFLIPENSIPVRLQQAVVQAALRSAAGDVLIQDQSQRVVEEKVDVLTVKYAEFSDPQTRYPMVTRLLTPLLRGAGGDGNFQVLGLVRT